MLFRSELDITVQSNQGKAEYQRSLQEAARIQTLAGARAGEIRALAEAESERAARMGIGQAIAIDEQVRAYGGPQFQLTQQVLARFAEAIQTSGVDVVPKILIGHGGGGGAGGSGSSGGQGTGGSVLEVLLSMLMSEKLGQSMATTLPPRDPQVEAMRRQIREKLVKDGGNGGNGAASGS